MGLLDLGRALVARLVELVAAGEVMLDRELLLVARLVISAAAPLDYVDYGVTLPNPSPNPNPNPNQP